jgi:hypothetical protein
VIRDKVSTLSRFGVALTGGVLLGIVFVGVAAIRLLSPQLISSSKLGGPYFSSSSAAL